MRNKKINRPRSINSGRWRNRKVGIVIAVVLSLFASWTLLVYSGAVDPLFKQKGKQSGTMSVQSFNSNSPSKEYIYAGGRLVATEEPSGGAQSSGTKAQFDFEGDLKTNISVFRPSDGNWLILNPDNATYYVVGWGFNGDKLVPADYDGDGKCDIAVFRPSDGTWWVKKSSDGQTIYKQFAASGDIPVPGDYDGDGKANIAVFRPSDGTWWILNPDNVTQTVVGWGIPGDKPVPADYDGDGKCDVAVFRPSNGTWWIKKSTAGDFSKQFAATGDIPVPGDYDGDGQANIAVFRPSDGTWLILNPDNATYYVVGWGIPADTPVPADYDGDGKCDVAVFRPSNGTWWIKGSTAGDFSKQFAVSGDIPVPSAFIQQ